MSADPDIPGYTTDVDYESHFGALQAPIHISVAAGLNGAEAPDPRAPFVYLDICCGDGENLVVLAACYPDAAFVGIDFNERHIHQARRKAEAADLANVRFIHGDVENFADMDAPRFDYAAITGAYAWLSPEKRNAVHKLLVEKANPVCAVFVDYAAQPGAAAADALYAAMRKLAMSASGSSAEKLAGAINRLQKLEGDGALFFKAYPTARMRLENMAGQRLEDEAHEVFNLHGGLWFSDVAAAFAQSDLVWAGPARLPFAFSPFSLPAACHEAIDAASPDDQALFDLMHNAPYRADIFTRRRTPPTRLSPRLLDLDVLNFLGEAALERARRLARRFPRLDPDALQTMLSEAATPRALSSLTAAGGASDAERRLLVGALLAYGLLKPLAAAPAPAPVHIDRVQFTNKFNLQVATGELESAAPRPLASPVAGTSVAMPLADRIALYLLNGGDIAAARRRLPATALSALGVDEPAFTDNLNRLVRNFARSGARDLVRLGIISA